MEDPNKKNRPENSRIQILLQIIAITLRSLAPMKQTTKDNQTNPKENRLFYLVQIINTL